MDRRIFYAIVVGIVMYILLLHLAYLQRDLTSLQLVLIFATPLVMGILSAGVKKGLLVGFTLSLVMFLIEVIILQWEALTDINIMMAVVIMMVLPLALLSAGLGALGGLVGKRLFK